MIALEYELTYSETIQGPLGPTSGAPLGDRMCWQITHAALRGPRIQAEMAMPRTDWIRVGSDGLRRQDLRAQFLTDDGELILFRYELALLRPSDRFLAALASGDTTTFEDQYMRIAPQFEVGAGRYAWPARACPSVAAGSPARTPSPYELYRVL
jgi:hypothetical protein